MSRITILMLSVNESSLLRWSLPAACAQGADEVVVIDNACTDSTPELIEQHGARRLTLRKRLGYAAAMNRGIASCQSEWLLFCNADCVLEPGFLDQLRPHLHSPGLGSVAPRIMRSTGMTPDTRLNEIDAAGMTIDRRRKNSLVGHGQPPEGFLRQGPIFGGDGACVLYSRACLESCSMGLEVFDEDMELWATDADLAWRAQLFGWSSRYEPRAVAWHKRFFSPTTRGQVDPKHLKLQFRNRLLMIYKNETSATFLRNLPSILFYEVAAFGWASLKEPFLFGAYLDFVKVRPRAKQRRKWVQDVKRRRARKLGAAAKPPFGLLPPQGSTNSLALKQRNISE